MTAARLDEGVFAAPAEGERLDRALAAELAPAHPALTRSRLKSMIEDRLVRLEGATVTEPSRRVKQGQAFALDLPAPVRPPARGRAALPRRGRRIRLRPAAPRSSQRVPHPSLEGH
ncbi:MAG: S4 domain-containing protein, partial [Alphaproteobacteria bacterium]